MALSNVEITKALKDGRLKIDPAPGPQPGSAETPYDTTSVDLRLGHEVAVVKDQQPISIDLRKRKFADLLSDNNTETYEISEAQPFTLSPNKFVLAKTLETVELPILDGGRSLCARVEGKSGYARCGMLVHFTAPTIHAGFKGTITLEIINLGAINILLYPEMYICQLILDTVVGAKPISKESQFHGQTRPGGQRGGAAARKKKTTD
ncbi:MAG: dCTP deaminase [Planctomycetota bacterium]